jgi:hypothetical protein
MTRLAGRDTNVATCHAQGAFEGCGDQGWLAEGRSSQSLA